MIARRRRRRRHGHRSFKLRNEYIPLFFSFLSLCFYAFSLYSPPLSQCFSQLHHTQQQQSNTNLNVTADGNKIHLAAAFAAFAAFAATSRPANFLLAFKRSVKWFAHFCVCVCVFGACAGSFSGSVKEKVSKAVQASIQFSVQCAVQCSAVF